MKVWAEISDELYAQCGLKCTIPQLKSKFNRLRKVHRDFSDLLEHTGFGWDPIANTVTASEDVWASYLKSKPKAKQFRTQGLEHYQLLGEIFNTTTATGQLHYASSQLPPNSDDERELENNFLNTGVHIDVDLDDDGDSPQLVSGKGKRKCATAAAPERRPKKWEKMESYLDVCSEVMSQKLQREKEKSLEASSTSKEMYSIEECIEIVETMVLDMSTRNEDNHSDSDSDLEEMAQHMIICMHIYEYWQSYVDRMPCHNSVLSGHEYVQELLNGHPDRIYDSFRMDKHVFQRLCYTLESLNLLQNDRHVSTQEAVAIFLFIVSHSIRMRVAAERFQRSKDTIHRQFKRVLGALCALAPRIIRPQSRGETPSQILNNPKYYPYFEKCIGAIDGTHVAAWAPAQKQTSYRGYYYVVDAGYSNVPGFLAPYRGERYHLRDYRGPRRAPRGPMELFNYRHSSLRNVIERCFGVLKARFPILKLMPNYPPRRQRRIPIACCVLHNFIRKEARRDRMFEEFQVEDMIIDTENTTPPNIDMSAANIAQMGDIRDKIAADLWQDFI
ncbi:hypothetical protein ACE6H2_020059 [Prunus campanulata]